MKQKWIEEILQLRKSLWQNTIMFIVFHHALYYSIKETTKTLFMQPHMFINSHLYLVDIYIILMHEIKLKKNTWVGIRTWGLAVIGLEMNPLGVGGVLGFRLVSGLRLWLWNPRGPRAPGRGAATGELGQLRHARYGCHYASIIKINRFYSK